MALQPELAEQADAGVPIVVAEPASPAAKEFARIAERMHAQARAVGMALPVINQ